MSAASRENLDELVMAAKEDDSTAEQLVDLLGPFGDRFGLFIDWATKTNPWLLRRRDFELVNECLRRAVLEAIRDFDPEAGAKFTTYLQGFGFYRVIRYIQQAVGRDAREREKQARQDAHEELLEGLEPAVETLVWLVEKLAEVQPVSDAVRWHLVAKAVMLGGMTLKDFAAQLRERAEDIVAIAPEGANAARFAKTTRETAGRWLAGARVEMARVALSAGIDRRRVRVILDALDHEEWVRLKKAVGVRVFGYGGVGERKAA